MSSPTATYHSGRVSIRWGRHEAHVSQESDAIWKVELDGQVLDDTWPTQDDAEEAANHLLRRIAGPNAAREGAEFGEG